VRVQPLSGNIIRPLDTNLGKDREMKVTRIAIILALSLAHAFGQRPVDLAN
jgi:hypothetical protein